MLMIMGKYKNFKTLSSEGEGARHHLQKSHFVQMLLSSNVYHYGFVHRKLFTLLSDDDARKQYILHFTYPFNISSLFCIFALKR